MWAGALLEALRREAPGHEATVELLRPHLQTGFPWHDPDRHHPETRSAAAWWDALDSIFERAYTAVGVEAKRAKRLARLVRNVYPDAGYWRLFDDTIPALNHLSALGWRHLILSNHVPELAEIVRHLGLDGHIEKVFNSAESGYEKPHPRAFAGVLEFVGGPERAWMIGDNASADVAGAEGVGLKGILVRKRDENVRHNCESLTEVPDIVGTAPRALP